MDDDVLTLGGLAQARRVGHRAGNGFLAGQVGARSCAVLEHPHRVAVVDEPLHDRRADEARRAGDEDPHVSKFFQ